MATILLTLFIIVKISTICKLQVYYSVWLSMSNCCSLIFIIVEILMVQLSVGDSSKCGGHFEEHLGRKKTSVKTLWGRNPSRLKPYKTGSTIKVNAS